MSGLRTITALVVQKKNKERVSVYLDGEFAVGVDLVTAARLHKGQQLSPAEVAALQQEDEQQRAYLLAVRYLGVRPRSRSEVERYLRRKEVPDELIVATVARLESENYLDDAEFARYWIANREQFRPRGARALRYELQRQGVERAIVDEVLESQDEESSAWAALERKLDGWRGLERDEFRKKAGGFLARRGFGYDIVKSAVERGWELIAGDAAPDEDEADFDN